MRFLLSLLISAPLFAAPMVVTQTEIDCTTTSALVLASNAKRSYLFVQNNGSATVHLKFGSAHSGAEAFIKVPAAWSYELPTVVTRAGVYCDSASGTNSLTIIEGTSP